MDTRMTTNQNQRPAKRQGVLTTPPRADVFENEAEYLVIADLPGTSQDALQIHLDAERLTLDAPTNFAVKGDPLSLEFREADYHRSFLLPEDIDRDKIEASLQNGVLTLRIPKSEAVRPRRIEVKAS